MMRAEAAPRVGWAFEPIIPSVGKVLLSGDHGSGKTPLALAIARRCLTEGRSVHLWLEEGVLRTVGEWFPRLGIRVPQPRQTIWHRKRKQLNAETIEKLARAMRFKERPVIIIDNLGLVNAGDENSTPDTKEACRLLDQLQAAHDEALVILVHHAAKVSLWKHGRRRPVPRGHSGFPAWADSDVLLTKLAAKKDEWLKLEAFVERHKHSNEPPPQRLTLMLNGEGVVVVDSDSTIRAAEPKVDLSADVLSTLKRTGPLSQTALRETLKTGKPGLGKLVTSLIASKQLRRVGRGPSAVLHLHDPSNGAHP